MILHGHLDTGTAISLRADHGAVRALDTRVLAFCRIPPQSVYQERGVHLSRIRFVVRRDGRFAGRTAHVRLQGRRRGATVTGILRVSYDRGRCTAADSFRARAV